MYNLSNLFKYADVIIPIENQTLISLCQKKLNIEKPTYSNLNKLIATCWSHITCSMRYNGSLLSNLNEFQTTLIPFPSLKLITSYISPLIPYSLSQNIDFQSPSVYNMCIPSLIEPNNGFINETLSYKFALSLCLLFRGENIIPKEIGQNLICEMKKWIRYGNRSSTGFRCGINYHRPYIFDDQSDISLTDKQVLMLINQTSTSIYLLDFILKNNEHKNQFFELKKNYEELENEILNDYQLNI